MAAPTTDLARACRAVTVYFAVGGGSATGRFAPIYRFLMTSHDQLALRPDRSFEIPVGARVSRLTVHDRERPHNPVPTLANSRCFCLHVCLIHFRRRDERVSAVKLRAGGRRRWRLRIRGTEQAEKSDDPQRDPTCFCLCLP